MCCYERIIIYPPYVATWHARQHVTNQVASKHIFFYYLLQAILNYGSASEERHVMGRDLGSMKLCK